jgi:putative transposase
LHGHSEREIALASAELRAQNRKSHIRTPIDAKRLADFLAKIEAHETVLLQRQRDIENQVVVYHLEQTREQAAEVPRPASLTVAMASSLKTRSIGSSLWLRKLASCTF